MQVRDVSENPLARQEASVNKGEDSQLETKILENSIHKICRSAMLVKPCPAARQLAGIQIGCDGCSPGFHNICRSAMLLKPRPAARQFAGLQLGCDGCSPCVAGFSQSLQVKTCCSCPVLLLDSFQAVRWAAMTVHLVRLASPMTLGREGSCSLP